MFVNNLLKKFATAAIAALTLCAAAFAQDEVNVSSGDRISPASAQLLYFSGRVPEQQFSFGEGLPFTAQDLAQFAKARIAALAIQAGITTSLTGTKSAKVLALQAMGLNPDSFELPTDQSGLAQPDLVGVLLIHLSVQSSSRGIGGDLGKVAGSYREKSMKLYLGCTLNVMKRDGSSFCSVTPEPIEVKAVIGKDVDIEINDSRWRWLSVLGKSVSTSERRENVIPEFLEKSFDTLARSIVRDLKKRL